MSAGPGFSCSGFFWVKIPMILLCGKDSSRSLREAGRPMESEVMTPGKTAAPRLGRIESIGGMGGRSKAAKGAPGESEDAEAELGSESSEFISPARLVVDADWQLDPKQAVSMFGRYAFGIHVRGKLYHAFKMAMVD